MNKKIVYPEESNTKIKATLIEILRSLISVIERNNLKYCVCCGTTLGAIRHKGFIPWDDDIDIYMPRADYNRLLSLRGKSLPKGYDLLSMQQNKGYLYPFAKYVDTRTTVWEDIVFPQIIGLYIDIFPVDCFDLPDDEVVAIQHRYKRLYRSYQWAFWHLNIKYAISHFPNGLKPIVYQYRRLFPNYYLNRFLDYEQSVIGQSGGKCVSLSQYEGRILYSKWFEETIDYDFENIKVKVPKYYDLYLKALFGDYMQLPPENERLIHSRVYVNLSERLTLKEVKQRLEKGEHFHA